MNDYEVVVIGSGITGMTAAIYLKRAGINVCIIEKAAPGGQLLKVSSIENYPGFIDISGPDLAANIYEQIRKLEIPYIFGEVIKIEQGKVILKTKEIKCQGIIIAAGRKPLKLGVENEEKLIGKGISYCVLCDGSLYKDQVVTLVGGGNSTLEEAQYLSKICKKVIILRRGDKLTGDKMLIKEIENISNIKILYNVSVEKFNIKNEILHEIVINEKGKTKKLKAAACFIFVGYGPATEIFKDLNITNDRGYIEVNNKMETKIPYIYACGDIIKKSLFQLVTCVSEGATAATSYIRSDKSLFK